MASDRSSDLIQHLYRISSLAGKIADPNQALEIVLDEMREATGASSGSISLIDPDTGRLKIEAQRGFPADCAGSSLRLGEGITGWVALHGKPVVVPDVRSDPRYRMITAQVQSEMAAPIEDRGHVIGVVNMNSGDLNAFDENGLQKLVALAKETAALLRQLWQVNNLTAKANHLEAVLNVGQGVVARLDQREVLQSITRETVPLSGCRLCAIHLLSEDQTTLLPHAISGGISGRQHPDLPVDETSAGVAVLRRRQLEVVDLLKTEGLFPLLEFARAEGLASVLCTPITFEDQVLGILSAYTGKTHRFSNDERNLFQAMAGLGAVAIHNARLYERVFQSEETLRQQEKLTALGLLAAEIAHEVRNPLTVLKLLFSSLDLDFPPEDPRHRDTEIISEKLNQLEATVGRVLAFAKPAEEYGLYPLDAIVADTLHLLRLKFEQAGVEVDFRPHPARPVVRGDKGQIHQILLNLLLNSLHAVETGGRISLRTGPEEHDGIDGTFLEIEDNGPGIPEIFQPQIFKSLLTGHPEGTGLGLGIVKRIVDSHRGKIDLVRTGSDGTVMRLWLPA